MNIVKEKNRYSLGYGMKRGVTTEPIFRYTITIKS
jgi:hypothetical protein